jgi:hypothetical protein
LRGPSNTLFDWQALRGAAEKAAPEAASAPIAPRGSTGRRAVAAAVGLAVAGAASPIAVAAMAASGGPLGPPLAASALVALLIVAPAGVGLAAALSGLRRTAAVLSAQGDSEAEQAVLRVFVDTLVFGWALGLAAMLPNDGAAPATVPVAALGLAAAWGLLLHVVLWPAAPPARRGAAMALDIALLSVFLHFGGRAVAGWYPLYLVAIFYAGFRFGLNALLGNAVAAMLGFAAVILSTPFWRQEPGLASGLLVALAVLPAVVAGTLRAIAAAQAAAAAADADRQGVLRLIADNLRPPLATLAAPISAGDEVAPATRAVASQIGDVLEFASLEAGNFAAPIEAFDLRALIKHGLAPLQASAAERGVTLRWRVDPHLPLRLHGRARAFAHILGSLAEDAVAAASAGTVRIALDAVAFDARRVRLRLRADGAGTLSDPNPASAKDRLAWRLVERMVAQMGGQLAIDRPGGRRARATLTLPLGIEEGTPEPLLDLGGCPVLIVTEDGQLADELARMLAAWRGAAYQAADADADDTLAELARLDPARRPVMIIDGRDRLLSALSLAHHAARLGLDAPFVLLIAEQTQIDSLVEVDEGELDGFIPAPVAERLLAGVLHALPPGPAPIAADPTALPRFADLSRPMAEPRRAAGDAADLGAGQITPIASHPRFVPEAAAAVDARVIEGLRALGGGPGFTGFLSELIESFRTEAGQLMEAVNAAVATGDTAGFARSLAALRRTAGPLGGAQLCELLVSLQNLTAGELRLRGAMHIQRLDAEIDRLAAALLDFLPASAARRP